MPTRLRLLLLVAPLLCGATADTTRFRPPVVPTDLLASETATVLQPMQYAAGAVLSYGHNPVVWRYADGTYDPVVAHQLMVDLTAGIGIVPLVDVGVVLPVALMQSGPDAQAKALDQNLSSVRGAGLGDLRLVPRLALVQERSFGFGLALVSEFTFPTGQDRRFLGDPSIAWRPRVVSTLPLPRLIPDVPLRASASLGYRLRKNADVADVNFGDEWDWHAGAEADLAAFTPRPITALLELGSATAATKPFTGQGLAAIELLAGVRTRVLDSVLLTVGAGAGLTSGVGMPDFRLLVGFAYAPLPPDRDGDGISDYADQCPDTPEDYDSYADVDGCPDPDNDDDGILDREDKCPDDPEDVEGIDDEDGCPENGIADRDGDGIPDEVDQCPDAPEDVDEFQDEDGCPDPDNDGDGVLDTDDKCPLEKETINGVDDWDGCPDEGEGVTEYIENVKIEIKASILFETSKATIKQESKPVLDQVALQILSHPEIKKVRIEGHTDSVGPEDENLYLSQDRADAVRRYLVGRGIAKERLVAVGYGETKPIDSNDTPAGRTRNRRVEFYILQE